MDGRPRRSLPLPGPALLALLLAAGGGSPLLAQQKEPVHRTVEPRPQPSPRAAEPAPRPMPPPPSPRGQDAQAPRPGAGPSRPSPQGDRPPDLPPNRPMERVQPRPLERWTVPPGSRQWRHRDLFAEIQAMARRGYVAAEPVADGTTLLKNFSKGVSGWQAYYLTVPAGESVHLRLRHPNEGWFRLLMMDKWGQAGRGMLQNRIPKGHPEVSFRNLSKEPQTVYVLVDDPGLMSSEKSPFEVLVTRSWKPGAQPLPPPPKAQGVWIHG